MSGGNLEKVTKKFYSVQRKTSKEGKKLYRKN